MTDAYEYSSTLKASLDNPEAKTRMSVFSRARWEDPVYRAKMAEIVRMMNAARLPQVVCKRGHSMDDACLKPDGRRRCRTCTKLRKAKYRMANNASV